MKIENNKEKKIKFIFFLSVIMIIIIGACFIFFKDGIEQVFKNNKTLNILSNTKNMEKLEVGKNYTTESGLQYQVLVLGEGVKPTDQDKVEVHYHGTLEDGTVFDSSVERGEKISFPLNRVISGWTEGLQLMPVGSKFKFVIPSHLAYGENSPSPSIPAGATLIFEVELFRIN